MNSPFTLKYTNDDGRKISVPQPDGDFQDALIRAFEDNGYPRGSSRVTLLAPNGHKLAITPIDAEDGDAQAWESNEALPAPKGKAARA